MGLTIWELFKNYIYTFITLYWSKKRPVFILKALNLNLNLHTNLLKVWTIFVVEVSTSFRWIKNGSNVLVLGLLLYLYPYHFILVPKKANIHFVRSYSKLGSFGQSSLDEVSVAPIMGLTIWELFKIYIYTFITLYWSKKKAGIHYKSITSQFKPLYESIESLDDLCRWSLHKFSVESKMGLTFFS